MTVRFKVIGDPAPKGSMIPMQLRTGRIVLRPDSPARLRRWMALVKGAAVAATRAADPLAEVPLRVELAFFLMKPPTTKAKDAPWTFGSSDVDKLARAVLDVLTGIVWKDDAQVVELVASKAWAREVPGLRCAVSLAGAAAAPSVLPFASAGGDK